MKQTEAPQAGAAAAVPKFPVAQFVPNFTCADRVKIEVFKAQPSYCVPCTVAIIQNSGSLSFQHNMTAEQARKMAEYLLIAADAIDLAWAAS